MLKLKPMLKAKAVVATTVFIAACSGGGGGGGGAKDQGGPAAPGKIPDLPRIDASRCIEENISRPRFPGFPGFEEDTPQTRLAEYIDRGDENCVKAVLNKGAKANDPVQIDNFPNGKLSMIPIFAALRERQLWRDGKEVGVLRALVEGGANVNVKNEQGETPLQLTLSNSILKDYPNASAYLISTKKCDLEQRDRQGLTPIWLAMQAGATETVFQLINAGANVSVLHPQGRNLLQAALLGRVESQTLAVTLIQKGVDPMAADRDGDNSLHVAARNKLIEVTNAILSKNIDVNVQNNARETALLLAVRVGANPIALSLLNKGADVNLASNKSAPIHEALEQNNDELFTAILPKVSDVNVLNASKNSPLLLATRHGSVAQVKALLGRGANANLAGESGITPLMIALNADQTDKVNELLPKSNVNQKTADGRTAAFFAINTTQLQNLLNYSADLNVRASNGTTVLSNAINGNKTEIATFVIEHGADVSWKNSDGDTLLHTAIGNNKLPVARALLERKVDANVKNVKGETPMFSARGANAVNLLVEFNGNINQKASDGRTVLSELVDAQLSWGNTWAFDVIQRLVELHVNVDVRGNSGAPLLHEVVTAREINIANLAAPRFKDEAKLASLLIDGGAKVNGLDAKRNTPLHLADSANEAGVLLSKGADRQAKNSDQRTPLQLNQVRKQAIEASMEPVQAEVDKISEELKKLQPGSVLAGHLMRKKAELEQQIRAFTASLEQVNKIINLLQ